MPIIHVCSTPDCSTLTMGDRCIDHEQPINLNAIFGRGRPFPRTVGDSPESRALERGRMSRLSEAGLEPAPRSAA